MSLIADNKQVDMKMQYLVVIEKGPDTFGAYVPDLPGCIAAGVTRDEVLRQIRNSIEARISALRKENRAIPHPASSVEVVEIKLPQN